MNPLITRHHDHRSYEILSGDSFLRTYYKILKAGRQSGSVTHIFITGVLPVTIDDVCSAYNIAPFITLDPVYEHMLGFTRAWGDNLMDEVYRDYNIDPSTRNLVDKGIKNRNNWYHFVKTGTRWFINPQCSCSSSGNLLNWNQSLIPSLIRIFELIWIL